MYSIVTIVTSEQKHSMYDVEMVKSNFETHTAWVLTKDVRLYKFDNVLSMDVKPQTF